MWPGGSFCILKLNALDITDFAGAVTIHAGAGDLILGQR